MSQIKLKNYRNIHWQNNWLIDRLIDLTYGMNLLRYEINVLMGYVKMDLVLLDFFFFF